MTNASDRTLEVRLLVPGVYLLSILSRIPGRKVSEDHTRWRDGPMQKYEPFCSLLIFASNQVSEVNET